MPANSLGMAGNADVRRQVVARAVLVADHAAHARELQRRAGPVAGEHVVRAALVGRLAVRHRADDGDLVGDLRPSCGSVSLKTTPASLVCDRAQLAAVLDRGVRLGVERLLVGHAAGQEDVDDALGLGLDDVVVLLLGLGLLERKKSASVRPSPPAPTVRKPRRPGFMSESLQSSPGSLVSGESRRRVG